MAAQIVGAADTDISAALPKWWQERLAAPSQLFALCTQAATAKPEQNEEATLATACIGQGLAVSAGHVPSAAELRQCADSVGRLLNSGGVGCSTDANMHAAADLLSTLAHHASHAACFGVLQTALLAAALPALPALLAAAAEQPAASRVLHSIADTLMAPHDVLHVHPRVSKLSMAPAAGASAAASLLRGVTDNMRGFFAALQPTPKVTDHSGNHDDDIDFMLLPSLQFSLTAPAGSCSPPLAAASTAAALPSAAPACSAVFEFQPSTHELHVLHVRLLRCAAFGFAAAGSSLPAVPQPADAPVEWYTHLLAAHIGMAIRSTGDIQHVLPSALTAESMAHNGLATACLHLLIRCMPLSLPTAQALANELLPVLRPAARMAACDALDLWVLSCQLAPAPQILAVAVDLCAAADEGSLRLLAAMTPHLHTAEAAIIASTVSQCQSPPAGFIASGSRVVLAVSLLRGCSKRDEEAPQSWEQLQQSSAWAHTTSSLSQGLGTAGSWLVLAALLEQLAVCLAGDASGRQAKRMMQQLLEACAQGCTLDNSMIPHLLCLLLPSQAVAGAPTLTQAAPGGTLQWGAAPGSVHDWGAPAAWMIRCFLAASPMIPALLQIMQGAPEPLAAACCAFVQYLFAQHPGASQALRAQHGDAMATKLCSAVAHVSPAAACSLLLSLSVSLRSSSGDGSASAKGQCVWRIAQVQAGPVSLVIEPNLPLASLDVLCVADFAACPAAPGALEFPLHNAAAAPSLLAATQQEASQHATVRPMITFDIVPGMGDFPVQAALALAGQHRVALLQRLTHIVQESAACAEALCTQANLHALLSALPSIGADSLHYVTYLLVALLEYRCTPRDVALLLMLTLLPTAAITALRIETKASRRAIAAKAAQVRAEREAAALSSASAADVSPSHRSAEAASSEHGSLELVAEREELQLQLLFILGRLLECAQPPAVYTWLEQADGAANMTPLHTSPAPLPTSTVTVCMWCRPVAVHPSASSMRVCTVSLGDVQLLLDLAPLDAGKQLFAVRCSLFAKQEGTWHQCANRAFSGQMLKLRDDWRHVGVSAGVAKGSRGVSLELVYWVDGRRQESSSQLLQSTSVDMTSIMSSFTRPAERGPVTALLGSAGAAPGMVGGVASAACLSGVPSAACIQELMQWPTKAAATVRSEQDALEAICALHGQVPLAALVDSSSRSASSASAAKEVVREAGPGAWSSTMCVQHRDTTGQHSRCSLADSLLRGIKLGEEWVASILASSGHSGHDAGVGNLGLATCLLPIMAASSRTQSASLRLIAQMLAVNSAPAGTAQLQTAADSHLMFHWWDSNAGFSALEYLLLSQLQRGRAKFAAYQSSIVEAASCMHADDVSPFSSAVPSSLPHKQVLSVLWNKEVFTELFNMMKAGDTGPPPADVASRGTAAGSGAASTASSATGSVSGSTKARTPRKAHSPGSRALQLIPGCALQSIVGLLAFCDACIITGMSTLVQSSAAFEQPVLSIVAGMEDVQAQVADAIAEALTEDRHSIEAWFAASRTPHPLPNGSDAVPGLTEAHARNNEDGPGIGRLLDMVRLAYPHLLPPSPLSDASLVPAEEISLLSRGNRRIRTPLLVALRKVLLRKQRLPSGEYAYGTVSQGELQVLFDFICGGCSASAASGSPAAAGELAALTDIVNCVLVALMSPGGEVLLGHMKLLSQGLWTIPMVLMDCAVPAVRCSGLRLLSILLQRPGLSKEADAFIIAGGVEAVAAVLAKWTISSDVVQTLIGLVAGFFRVGVVPESMRGGAPALSRERSSGSLGNASDHTSRRYNSWHHGSELRFAQPYFLSCLLMLLSVCRDPEVVLRSLSDVERAVSPGRTADAAENVEAWLATHGWFRQLASFEASWRDGGLTSSSWLNRLGPAVAEGSNMASEEPTKLPGAAAANSGAFEPMLGAFSPPAGTDEGSTVSSSLLEGDVVHASTPTEDASSPDFVARRNRTYSRERPESHGGSRVSHPSLRAGSADGSDGGRGGGASAAAFEAAHSIELHEASGAVSVDGSLSHDAFGSGSASDSIVQRVHSILRQLLLFDLQHRNSEHTSQAKGMAFRESAAIADAFGAGAGWHDVIKCVDNPGFQIAALRDILQGLQAQPELHSDTCALFGRNFSKLIRSSVSLLGQSLPPALHVHMVGVINLISMRNAPEVRQKLSMSGLMAARDLVTVSLLQRCGHDLDVVAEAVAALEPAFESVSMSCAPAVKECGGVYRLLHLVLIAACAAEMDLAAVLLRICGQLTRASDDAARAVSKCTEHPFLLAQLFRGMEVPASILGAGGSWMSMTSWRYGSTAAAAAAIMHSADDPSKPAAAAAAAGSADLVEGTDSFLQWLRPLLLGSTRDGSLVAAATVFASRVQDGFKAAAGTTDKMESKLQLSRGKAIRARIEKVTQQRRKTAAQVHAIAKQLTKEVLASRRRETFRIAHRESQRRVRLTQGRHLWKGSKSIVSRMMQSEMILGVDLQPHATEAGDKPVAVVPVRPSTLGSSVRSSTVLSGSEMELDAATRSLPGLRRVKVARARTGTKSSGSSMQLSGAVHEATYGEDPGAFDFGASWGKLVDILLQ